MSLTKLQRNDIKQGLDTTIQSTLSSFYKTPSRKGHLGLPRTQALLGIFGGSRGAWGRGNDEKIDVEPSIVPPRF